MEPMANSHQDLRWQPPRRWARRAAPPSAAPGLGRTAGRRGRDPADRNRRAVGASRRPGDRRRRLAPRPAHPGLGYRRPHQRCLQTPGHALRRAVDLRRAGQDDPLLGPGHRRTAARPAAADRPRRVRLPVCRGDFARRQDAGRRRVPGPHAAVRSPHPSDRPARRADRAQPQGAQVRRLRPGFFQRRPAAGFGQSRRHAARLGYGQRRHHPSARRAHGRGPCGRLEPR